MLKEIRPGIVTVVLFTAFLLMQCPFSFAGYDDFTINVPNAQGGYTAIVIKKSGSGYLGPQGEYYPEFPKVAQLQTMYGLGSPNTTVVVPAYVEPQAQNVVTYQVVNQAPYQIQYEEPYQDRDEYDDRPVYRHDMPEVEDANYRKEDGNDWTFFEFKKKKKSQQPQTSNQNPPNASKPNLENKGQATQKQKTDHRNTQGQ